MEFTKSGWMTKQGANFKTWKLRFFVLKGKMLSYFKSETSSKPKGVINMGMATGVVPCTIPKFPNKACFKIETPGRIYNIVCDTEDDQKAWIETLNNVCGEKKAEQQPEKEVVGPNDFELLKVVGKGSFGKVMQVRSKKDGCIYAMKVLSKQHIIDNNEIEHTMAEKETLAKIHHPFLVNLHYSFQTEDKLFLILDFVNGGELFFHLQNDQFFDNDRTKYYAAEILLAIEALHNAGIIYRDLKPENLLLNTDGNICITDFGLCKSGLNAQGATDTFCGTPEYLAPEVLLGKGYGFEVDWWSFGSIIFEMLTGFPPFFSEDQKELYKKIISSPVEFPDTIQEPAKDIIAKLLEKDPAKRLSDSSVMKKHKFFEGIDWDLLLQRKLKAPFIPPVASNQDTSQIDPYFTDEKPSTDVGTKTARIEKETQDDFTGFTYVASEK